MSDRGYRALTAAALLAALLALQNIMDHIAGPLKKPFYDITFYIIFIPMMFCIALCIYDKVKRGK